jgi:two-component system nitrogen regulation sensor histidine kinase NtrY
MSDTFDDLPANRSRASMTLDLVLGRVSTLLLASTALALGIATFAILAGRVKLTIHSSFAVGLSVGDFAVLLLLIIVLVGRVTRVVLERRRGAAGARLHVRLVFLFGGVAAVPAILVAIFATVFFNIGIQAWFNQRVQSALDQSSQVAQGYLDEHNNDITVAALTIANDLFQNGSIYLGDSSGLANFLSQEVGIRGLTEAAIIDPVTREQIATAGIYLGGMGITMPSQADIAAAAAASSSSARRTPPWSAPSPSSTRNRPRCCSLSARSIPPSSITSAAPRRRSPNTSASRKTAAHWKSPSP